MSNRNFDSRVIIQRLQNQCYARNIYGNNINGNRIISNPQTSDATSSRYITYDTGAQTEYSKGLIGECVTISPAGTCSVKQDTIKRCIIGYLNYSFTYIGVSTLTNDIIIQNIPLITIPYFFTINPKITIIGNNVNVFIEVSRCEYINGYPNGTVLGDYGISFNGPMPVTTFYNTSTTNLTFISNENCPFSSVGSQFKNLTNIIFLNTFIPLFNPNTSLSNCFENCTNFNSDISYWNTSNVTNMFEMFRNAVNFNQPLNNWDVSNVTNMGGMFRLATNFNQPLNNWNVSNVTNMGDMFRGSAPLPPHLFNQPIGNWDTSKVTDMASLFNNTINFNQDISNWNTSSVTTMANMFIRALSFNQPIGLWSTSNVTNMAGMFREASSFNQPIGLWNTTNVTNMVGMFQQNSIFNQPIGAWNTSKVTDMNFMFQNAFSFNQPIGTWNTSSVTNMTSMFRLASSFNQNLSNWSTSNVINFSNMFLSASTFNNGQSGLSSIGITPAIAASSFYTSGNRTLISPGANFTTTIQLSDVLIIQTPTIIYSNIVSSINNISSVTLSTIFAAGIGNLSTGTITSIDKQVSGTAPLNWNTINATNMNSMFNGATFFNQNITKNGNIWNTDKVGNIGIMFSGTTSRINLFNNGQIIGGITAPMGWTFNSTPTLISTNYRLNSRLTNQNRPASLPN